MCTIPRYKCGECDSRIEWSDRYTETIVTGLTPGARYIFSVTAENAVSSLENSGYYKYLHEH